MNRQLKLAKGLMFFVCLMVLLCINQRAVGERVLGSFISPVNAVSTLSTDAILFLQQSILPPQSVSDSDETKLSTCDLSAKSLLPLLPITIEPLFFLFFCLSVLSLLCFRFPARSWQRIDKHPPPRVRIHLQFCNLRD